MPKDLSTDQLMLYLAKSEDITLQLINTKCIPILLYGLEACPLLKSDLSSLDFIINRLFVNSYLKPVI